MRRDTQNVILGLLGGALIKVTIGGGYLAYVRPSHQPWLLGAGVVMLGLALVGIVRDLRAPNHPLPRPDPTHSHGQAHPVGHAPWLMVLPVLAILLVPPAALGADAVARTSGNALAAEADEFAPLPASPSPQLPISDVVARAMWDRSGSLANREITLTGFVVRRGAEVSLARLAISCCAADARPSTVRLVGSDVDYPADTWLRVRGRLNPGTATEATRYVPTLSVTDVTVVAAPEDPYEY